VPARSNCLVRKATSKSFIDKGESQSTERPQPGGARGRIISKETVFSGSQNNSLEEAGPKPARESLPEDFILSVEGFIQ
jgi:hypothetical protein